jgi:zinc transport system substrate-binding protein
MMNTKYLIVAGGVGLAALLLYVVSSGGDGAHSPDGHGDEHTEQLLVAKEPVRADGTFTVVTSFYPLAFALERIGGDLVVVENIGAGQDPHDFEPSTQDVLALQQADLVVLQGADFEPWGDDVKEQLAAESVPVLVATAGLDLREGGHAEHDDEIAHEEDEDHSHVDERHEEEHHDEDGHSHGAYDPHTWLDPVLMSEMVEHIAEGLATLDPENAETYLLNEENLRAELAQLDTEYSETLGQCEVSKVITTHEAFGYVGERYGFEIYTIAGLSTQDMPSAVTMAALRAEAQEGVGAILLEESSVTAYGETLARETGLQTLTINPIAFLVPEGEDYLTLSRSNLETFATALKCNG